MLPQDLWKPLRNPQKFQIRFQMWAAGGFFSGPESGILRPKTLQQLFFPDSFQFLLV